MIEARWYGSLVMSLEDMGGPIILDTETDDIVEAYDEAVRYEMNSHGCMEIESHVLYRDGVEIPFEEIAKAFEERYGSDDEPYYFSDEEINEEVNKIIAECRSLGSGNADESGHNPTAY